MPIKKLKFKIPDNAIIDTKQMLGSTEFCFILTSGEEVVWRICSVGTEEWNMWKSRWDELRAELKDQCTYYYRIAL